MSELKPLPANDRCTCAEVWGENPRCALHGIETQWALENSTPEDWQNLAVDLLQTIAAMDAKRTRPQPSAEPVAYLKEWDDVGARRLRVDLRPDHDPWLDHYEPTVTPLYPASALEAARREDQDRIAALGQEPALKAGGKTSSPTSRRPPMPDVAEIAGRLSEAQRRAVQDADRSGCIPTIAAIVALLGVDYAFGTAAAFWLGLGALITCLLTFWEEGRNIATRDKATEQWVRAYLENSREQ